MATTRLQIRVDENLIREASEIYDRLGLDTNDAIRLFLKRTVKENGLPFSMTLPDEE